MDVRSYLGQPWESGGFDCWGLVRQVYDRELGIDVPVVPVLADDAREVCRAFASHPVASLFSPISSPQPLCVVGMSRGGAALCHVGVYVLTADGARVLHNQSGHGVTCVPFSELDPYQVIGFYQYAPRGISSQPV